MRPVKSKVSSEIWQWPEQDVIGNSGEDVWIQVGDQVQEPIQIQVWGQVCVNLSNYIEDQIVHGMIK